MSLRENLIENLRTLDIFAITWAHSSREINAGQMFCVNKHLTHGSYYCADSWQVSTNPFTRLETRFIHTCKVEQS